MRYHVAARVLHWLMAAGFAFQWSCGYVMTRFDIDPLYDVHISVGVTLLALMVARIAIRLAFRPPPPSSTLSRANARLAHLGHLVLYVLPLGVIALGWLETDLGGHGVRWFGLDLPQVVDAGPGEETAATAHQYAAYTLLICAAGHALMALLHGRSVLDRMLIRRQGRPTR